VSKTLSTEPWPALLSPILTVHAGRLNAGQSYAWWGCCGCRSEEHFRRRWCEHGAAVLGTRTPEQRAQLLAAFGAPEGEDEDE
jgi:hypothetical protein